MMSYLAHSKRARVDTDAKDGHRGGTASNGSSVTAAAVNGLVVDRTDQLALHTYELYLRTDYSDIEFVFGPDVIPGHKAIIAVNSKWRQLIRTESTVDMDDTPLQAFKELLRFLYSGRLDLDQYEPPMLAEIRELAERFEMWDISRAIEDIEDTKVSADNCLQLLADSALDSRVARQCLDVIVRNIQELIHSDELYDVLDADRAVAVFSRNDLNVSEQTVFESVKRYIAGSGKGDMKKVLSAVRFSLLPFEYLWLTVRKWCEEHKLMSIDELSDITAAKARLSDLNADIRERAHCLPNTSDVVALNAKTRLATRVLRGRVGDEGDEANVVELDLGLPYLITGMGVSLSTASKTRYAFKVEVAMNPKEWQTLYDFTRYHTSNKLDLAFDPQVVRYIKLSDLNSYPDWSGKRKDSKPVRKIQNIVAVYEEPQGVVRRRDNLLDSKYLLRDLSCDFTYESWFKKDNKYFYVCPLNDPIVCILSQPVWMDTISLFFAEDGDKQYNFTVEVTADMDADLSKSVAKVGGPGRPGGRNATAGGDKKSDKSGAKGWLMVADFRNESRTGEVEVTFGSTVVNAFRVTGTGLVNPTKPKDKDFVVEIRI